MIAVLVFEASQSNGVRYRLAIGYGFHPWLASMMAYIGRLI